MRILAANLAQALSIAIRTRSDEEKEMGYKGNSAFVDGLKDVLAAMQRGERIEVSGSLD